MMSKPKRRASGDRHIRLHHWMLRSAAWAALSPNGKAVLLDLWKRHNGANNGQIVYSAQEAGDALHASKTTGWRALDELVRLGFLRITRDAAFRLKSAKAREYALTAEPVDSGVATKDFMRWRPTETATKKQNTVSPVKPDGFTHETVNRVIPKTPRKNNGLSEGAGGGQNGPGGTPQETAKNPQETAKNRASTVSPMKPSGGTAVSWVKHFYISMAGAARSWSLSSLPKG
jgi:hypothetical protein